MCLDQLLVDLADPQQIASITLLSAVSLASGLKGEIEPLLDQGLVLNMGRAEEVLPLQPDLVLVDFFSAQPTATVLRRLGYRVEAFAFATTLDDVVATLDWMGGLLGQEARAEAEVLRFEAERAAILAASQETGPPPSLAILTPGLRLQGRETLLGDAAALAGWRNKAEDWGVETFGALSLETLITDPPDALVLALDQDTPASQQVVLLDHPALTALADDLPVMQLSSDTWVCGTRSILQAARSLLDLRATLDAKGQS
ncbi:MAG: ABC transporter substrate-binding protein [Pseudomonadota bacterium]